MPAQQTDKQTEKRTARSGALNSNQKSGVRVALVTAATVVTLMGAQILALGNSGRTASAATTSNTFTNSAEPSTSGFTQSLEDDANVVFGNTSDSQYSRSNRSIQLAQSQPLPFSQSSR